MCRNILNDSVEKEEAEIALLRKKIAILDKAVARLKERLYGLVDIVHNFKQDKGEALWKKMGVL